MKQWYQQLILNFERFDANEILINGPQAIIVKTADKTHFLEPVFTDLPSMTRELQEFALLQQITLTPKSPTAGSIIENDQIRWHCILPPAAPNGPILILRKHKFSSLQLAHFQASPNDLAHLNQIFTEKKTILICGPTAAGKTSLLYCLLRKHCSDNRLVILERFSELPTANPHWLHLHGCEAHESKNYRESLSYLFQESLRISPDRIILGEVRGGTCQLLIEAISAGHTGSCATIHASSTSELKTKFRLNSSAWGQLTLDKNSVWCVFMERGFRPKITRIEKLFL